MTTRPSLVRHGGWAFLVTAVIGRQPPAMVQLGLLMYVAAEGLGLPLGGATVAAVGLGTALSATLIGRLVDAFGPLPVVAAATVVQVSGLAAIRAATPGLVAGTVPHGVLLLLAGLCGLANPQIGPIVRAHWSHLSRARHEPGLVGVALGYEGAMDEMSFIVGPVVASLLVAALGPGPALYTLMAIIVAGQGVFIVHLWFARAEWGHSPAVAGRDRAPTKLPFRALLPPMVILLAVGVTFGSVQTALTAQHAAAGTEYLTGIIYGSVGIGSACSSIVTPRLPPRISTATRLLFGACGLVLAGVAFSFLLSLWPALVVAILMGVGIGVVLVTGFARAEEVAPTGRIASAMTMLSMCLTLGVSFGAALAGRLSEVPARGFWPVVVSGLVAILASRYIAHQQRRARRG